MRSDFGMSAVTYYAIVNAFTSRESPAGLIRRFTNDAGERERDETLSAELQWERSSLLYDYECGQIGNKFILITENEAEKIVAHMREGLWCRKPRK
jgi:hypothetical protein